MSAIARGGSAGIEVASLPAARIGPNAVIRLAEAVEAASGRAAATALLAEAGLVYPFPAPLDAMVDETLVIRLHRGLRRRVDGDTYARIAADAGRRTGDYLLANRIPRAAALVLRHLPRGPALQLLTGAIAGHAWTFAGSGRFGAEIGPAPAFVVEASPLTRTSGDGRPACIYYAATFERLLDALLRGGAVVEETACAAAGAPACRFTINQRR